MSVQELKIISASKRKKSIFGIWRGEVSVYIIFFVSILAHELGHFCMAKTLGVSFDKVRIFLFGFFNRNEKLLGIKNSKKILIFLSGPIINFFIAILFSEIKCEYQFLVVFTNFFLFLVNLLPIVPLDGGNILICLLRYKFKTSQSLKFSLSVSKIVLILISVLYSITILMIRNVWILFMIFYLWYLYLQEEHRFLLYFKARDKVDKMLLLILNENCKL